MKGKNFPQFILQVSIDVEALFDVFFKNWRLTMQSKILIMCVYPEDSWNVGTKTDTAQFFVEKYWTLRNVKAVVQNGAESTLDC